MATKTTAKKTRKPATKAKKPVTFKSLVALVNAKRGYTRRNFPRGVTVTITPTTITATIKGQAEPALAPTKLADGMAALLTSFGLTVATGKAKATAKKKPLAKGKVAAK